VDVVQVCACVFARVFVCVYIHMHTHTHTHTHTHKGECHGTPLCDAQLLTHRVSSAACNRITIHVSSHYYIFAYIFALN
jgi:hypothetical protein